MVSQENQVMNTDTYWQKVSMYPIFVVNGDKIYRYYAPNNDMYLHFYDTTQ